MDHKIIGHEKSHPHLTEFFALLPTLNKESARGAVLVAASFLDEQLREILKAFLLDDKRVEVLFDGYNAPLGSLAARTTAAFGLCLISEKEFQECQTLRKIRNEFAHNHRATFSDPKVKDLCGLLTFKAQDYASEKMGAVVVPPQGQFSTSATALILNLTNRPAYVTANRIRPRDWPY